MSIAGDGTQWLKAAWGNTSTNLFPFTIFGWYWLKDTTADLMIGGFGNSAGNGSAAVGTGGGPARANAVSDTATFAQPTSGTTRLTSWVPALGLFTSLSSRSVYDISRTAVANTTTITVSTFTDISIMTEDTAGASWQTPAGSFVAEFAVWTTGLSTPEINTLLQGANPLTVRRDKIFCYFPLRDSITDYGPNSFSVQPQTTAALTFGHHPPVPPYRQTRSYGFLPSAVVAPVPFSRQRTYLRR